ncbi:MAG: hypothetical protein V3V33_12580 [Candidatus Lokiarchaeia archaeon]
MYSKFCYTLESFGYNNKITYSKKKNINFDGKGYKIVFPYKNKKCYQRYNEKRKIEYYACIKLHSKGLDIRKVISRLLDDLNSVVKDNSLTKRFCQAIIKDLKKCYNLPFKKFNIRFKKTKKSEFHITSSNSKTVHNKSMDLELLFLENIVRELKSCRIIDKNSVRNLFNLGKVNKGNNLRLHQFRYVFNTIEWSNLSRTIRDTQLSIWSPNEQSIMLSIGSKQNKELCNLELLNKGFEQIAERFNIFEYFKIAKLLIEKEVNIELGVDVLSSEEEIRELGFEFLPKTYKIYETTFWFDKSRRDGIIELDISFNCRLTNLVKAFKLIESYNRYVSLYEKGIIESESFDIAPSIEKGCSIRNVSANFKENYNELQDFIAFSLLEPKTNKIKNQEIS